MPRGVQDRQRVQPRRQRKLDQVTGALRVGVQLVDHGLYLCLAGVGGQLTADAGDAHFQAVAVLAVDVGAAARVVPDQHRAQPRHLARGGQPGHPLLELGLDGGRGSAPVQSNRGHLGVPLSLVPVRP